MTKKVAYDFIPVLILLAVWCLPSEARQITDMAGRRVEVPDVIRKVYGTSPPATYMVYAIDQGMVAGLNSPLNRSEKQYLNPRMQKLPVIGGWFGQGRTANLETLLQVRPDIVLVWLRQQMSAVNEKAEQAMKPLGIPMVHIVIDSLSDYPAAFRFLGELFNQQDRARALGLYAEQALEDAAAVRAAIPDADRVPVYYAEGADGLSTECHTSVHAELIPLCGGENVHRCIENNIYGMQKLSMEQVLRYDPQVIVFHEPLFCERLATDSKWKNISAVRNGRVYRIPRTPFNWFDRPPSFMRLLGLKWMANHLYPSAYPIDLVAETQRFYQLFLNVTLDEAAAREASLPVKGPMIISIMLTVLGMTALISLCLGRYPVTLGDLAGFAGLQISDGAAMDDRQYHILKNILIDIRMPRIAAAILIGAALSVSGVVFQSMFINPLVSPGILGVLAGASFGAALGMILAKNWLVVQLGAFSFGLIAVFAAVAMSALGRVDRLLMLILGGIISGALFTSLLSVVKYLADPYEQLPAIVYWLMGGLSAVDGNTVLAASGPIITGILVLLFLSGYLNALSMGDEEARSLGLNVNFLRFLFILMATVISALTVVMGGIIGWVGLLIPHIARMIVGPDNRILLPASALIGATYMLIADDIARLLFSVEIPIGILTSLVGIPFFAFVLRKAKKGWN